MDGWKLYTKKRVNCDKTKFCANIVYAGARYFRRGPCSFGDRWSCGPLTSATPLESDSHLWIQNDICSWLVLSTTVDISGLIQQCFCVTRYINVIYNPGRCYQLIPVDSGLVNLPKGKSKAYKCCQDVFSSSEKFNPFSEREYHIESASAITTAYFQVVLLRARPLSTAHGVKINQDVCQVQLLFVKSLWNDTFFYHFCVFKV